MAARSLEAGWWAYARGIEAGAHGLAAGHHAFRIDVMADHRDVLSAADSNDRTDDATFVVPAGEALLRWFPRRCRLRDALPCTSMLKAVVVGQPLVRLTLPQSR